MRLFSGLSMGRRGARVGISHRGQPWAGARTGGPAGSYFGVRSGGSSRPPAGIAHDGQPVLVFAVDERGRIFLDTAELDREDLRRVLTAADEAARRLG